ncbi:MAG: TonB-dependent receptor [Pseudomonadota bacterium]
MAKTIKKIVLIGLVTNFLSPYIALAQSENEELVGDEIIVGGELLDRTIQESQTSVTVVTGEELERRNDVDLRDIVDRVPGVTTTGRGTAFVIRGVDERGIGVGSASAPAITTTIDGARITDFGRTNTTFLPTWDVEQVEFLRGPQSTQTGRNALAGAVVVKSKDPVYDTEFKLRLGAGSGRTFQGAFAANEEIIENTLALRFAGEFNSTDGFVENPPLDRDDDAKVQNFNVRGGIRFDPTDDFSAILKISYFDAFDGFQSSLTSQLPSRVVFSDAETSDDAEYFSANLRLAFDFNENLSIESETTFVDRRFLFSSDFDNGPEPLATAFEESTGDSFSQEVKLAFENDWISAVVGGFYTNIEESVNGAGTIPAELLVDPTATLPTGANLLQTILFLTPNAAVFGSGVSSSEETNFAFFGEVDIEVVDGLRFIVGGRYDRETVDRTTTPTTTTNSPLLALSLPVDQTETISATFDAFLPKAGVVYEFTDDVSLGFTYQRGYRAGGADFNLATNQQTEFDPEFTNNFEVSFRSTWFDEQLTVNANLFYTDWTDQQVVIQGPTNITVDRFTVNAGSSTLMGGEIDVRARPFDGLDVYGTLGYVETEFQEFTSDGVSFAGNEFRNAPKFTGSVGGVYDFYDGFFVGADATYTSGSFSDPQNDPALRADPRFVLDFRAGYRDENFSVTAFVDNATNVTFFEERSPTFTTVSEPRTFGVIGQIGF